MDMNTLGQLLQQGVLSASPAGGQLATGRGMRQIHATPQMDPDLAARLRPGFVTSRNDSLFTRSTAEEDVDADETWRGQQLETGEGGYGDIDGEYTVNTDSSLRQSRVYTGTDLDTTTFSSTTYDFTPVARSHRPIQNNNITRFASTASGTSTAIPNACTAGHVASTSSGSGSMASLVDGLPAELRSLDHEVLLQLAALVGTSTSAPAVAPPTSSSRFPSISQGAPLGPYSTIAPLPYSVSSHDAIPTSATSTTVHSSVPGSTSIRIGSSSVSTNTHQNPPSTPRTGSKRRQADSPNTRKTKKQVRNAKRLSNGRFSDDAVYKHSLDIATLSLKAEISSSTPYPTKDELESLVATNYQKALMSRQLEIVKYPLTTGLERMLSTSVNAARGKVRSAVQRCNLAAHYGLYPRPSTDEQKQSNADRVRFLIEDSAFSYATIEYTTRQKFGIYQNPIIVAVIESAWYEGKQKLGVRFRSKFSPISSAALALVLTAIRHELSLWTTGMYISRNFDKDQKPWYMAYLRKIRELELEAGWRQYVKRMSDNLRASVGADSEEETMDNENLPTVSNISAEEMSTELLALRRLAASAESDGERHGGAIRDDGGNCPHAEVSVVGEAHTGSGGHCEGSVDSNEDGRRGDGGVCEVGDVDGQDGDAGGQRACVGGGSEGRELRENNAEGGNFDAANRGDVTRGRDDDNGTASNAV